MCSVRKLISIKHIIQKMDSVQFSIHSANIPEVHDMPMSAIVRPIPSILDHDKVKSLMESISKDPNYEDKVRQLMCYGCMELKVATIITASADVIVLKRINYFKRKPLK